MTIRRRTDFLAVSGMMAGLSLTFVGCTTANLEDAMPQAAGQPSQIVRPGEYPNLNITPQPAASQLTEAEKQALVSELRARRTAQAAEARAAAGTTGNAAALRRLADTHAEDALKAIEGN